MYPCAAQPRGWCGSDTVELYLSLVCMLGLLLVLSAVLSLGALNSHLLENLLVFPGRVTSQQPVSAPAVALLQSVWVPARAKCGAGCSLTVAAGQANPDSKCKYERASAVYWGGRGPRHNLVGSLAKTKYWSSYQIKGPFLGYRGFPFFVGSSSFLEHLNGFARYYRNTRRRLPSSTFMSLCPKKCSSLFIHGSELSVFVQWSEYWT